MKNKIVTCRGQIINPEIFKKAANIFINNFDALDRHGELLK